MDRRPSFVRHAGLLAVALLAATGVVSCGRNTVVGKAPVATVGDHDIDRDELDEAIEVDRELAAFVAKNPSAAQYLSTNQDPRMASEVSSFEGLTDDTPTLPTSGVTGALRGLIIKHLIDQAGEHEQAEVDEARTRARESIESELTQYQIDIADMPEGWVERETELRALQLAVLDTIDVSDAALREAYDEQKDSLANYCIDAILTTEQTQAEDASERINAGEDFQAVLSELNTDETLAARNGDAGCGSADQVTQSLGPDVVITDEGKAAPPYRIPTGAGWVVSRVRSKTVPELAEVEEQLKQSLVGDQADTLFSGVLRRTRVTIDPRYGTWDRTTVSVLPPGSGTTTSTVASEAAGDAGS